MTKMKKCKHHLVREWTPPKQILETYCLNCKKITKIEKGKFSPKYVYPWLEKYTDREVEDYLKIHDDWKYFYA